MAWPFVIMSALVGVVAGTLTACASARMVAVRTGEYQTPSRRRLVLSSLTCACVFASIAASHGTTGQSAEFAALSLPLLAAALADLDAWLIPRDCVWAMVAVRTAFLLSALMTQGGPPALALLADSLAGAFAVTALIFVAMLFMERTQAQDGLGGGDARLLAAVGFAFGWRGGLLATGLACLFGLCHALVRHLRKRDFKTFPFAPSIALACWVVALCGEQIIFFTTRLFS